MHLLNPTETTAWAALSTHFNAMEKQQIKLLFEKETNRFQQFTLTLDDILVDFSKNCINQKTVELLVQLATECGLKDAMKGMLEGKKINHT
jgi:glucose-6-phosphate isomerase